MIKFHQNDPKKYVVFNGKKELASLNLIPSTVTNKFSIIANFIEGMSKKSPDFTEWFDQFLTEYTSEVEKYPVIEKNVDNIKKHVDEYFDNSGIDFSQFVDETKSKKTSILFNKHEIEKIARLSGYLKIYAVISNSENLRIDQRSHKDIYNKLSYDIMNSEVAYKIFNVVKTKTFRYNLTDKFMWDYIKAVQCKTIDVHVIEIFNFIMNSIMILCEEDKNPITYFVGVVEESVKWFLRSVYKGSIIYSDSISTEDIQSPNIDNLRTYAYNDTLGRLKKIAYEQISEGYRKESVLTFDETNGNSNDFDNEIVDFQNRADNIRFVSPLCDCIVFPILSRLTKIPYNHFKTIPESQAAILSVYVQNLMKKAFKGEYKNLISLLSYYPTSQVASVTTYKLKTMTEFISFANEYKMFGFTTKVPFANALSYFVGRSSRIQFCNLIDGKELGGIPLSKIEQEMINLFVLWFSGELEDKFEEMKKIFDTDF